MAKVHVTILVSLQLRPCKSYYETVTDDNLKKHSLHLNIYYFQGALFLPSGWSFYYAKNSVPLFFGKDLALTGRFWIVFHFSFFEKAKLYKWISAQVFFKNIIYYCTEKSLMYYCCFQCSFPRHISYIWFWCLKLQAEGVCS